MRTNLNSRSNFQTSSKDGKHAFTCQHGEGECQGNRLHSCAIKHYSTSDALDFVRCSMASRYPPDAGPECSKDLGLDYSKIETCLSSGEGHELLATNGRKTNSLSPSLYFVPWIVYDGKWTEEDMEMSLMDAQSVVCEKIGPEDCDTENRGSRRIR